MRTAPTAVAEPLKIGHQGRQPIGMVLRPTVFDLHIAAIDIAGLEPVEKGRQLALVVLRRLRVQKSDDRPPALTAPARDAIDVLWAGTKERPLARTKELRDMRSVT